MEYIAYDHLVSVSPDSSTPHTPSPRSSLDLDLDSAKGSALDLDQSLLFQDSFLKMEPYPDSMDSDGALWAGTPSSPFFNPQRGSLLHELYNVDDHPAGLRNDWQHQAHQQHPPHHSLPPHMHEHMLTRRASYPVVRSDHPDDGFSHPQAMSPSFLGVDHAESAFGPYASRQDTIYCEPLSMGHDCGSPSLHQQQGMGGDPGAFQGHPHHAYLQHPSLSQPPQLEESYLCNPGDNMPVIVPSQHVFYPNGSSPGMAPMFMSPLGAIPIQHTDDAASKETQYLRRRCFNCHTTEPPSWRRSTLNPGKIVCNKCGLYERTHLRPRPHRFDELRAGNKVRKHSTGKVLGSPKDKLVKKEPGEYDLDGDSVRRGSVSGSSVASGCSDYDDAVSVYSSSSVGTGSSFNSPLMSSFSVPRLSPSLSPPMLSAETGGIKLPNAPLCDIASLQSQSPGPVPLSPRKAATVPYYGTNGRPITPALHGAHLQQQQQGDYFAMRHGSMPVVAEGGNGSQQLRHVNGVMTGMPEVTGWQTVPLSELEPKTAGARSRSGTASSSRSSSSVV